MARENLPHFSDKVRFVDLVLRRGLPLEIFLAIPNLGQASAKDQVLDLDFAVSFFVRTLNDGARRVAPVGILHLLTETVLGIAEIKLGANAGIAQRRHHFLVARDLAAEYRD